MATDRKAIAARKTEAFVKQLDSLISAFESNSIDLLSTHDRAALAIALSKVAARRTVAASITGSETQKRQFAQTVVNTFADEFVSYDSRLNTAKRELN